MNAEERYHHKRAVGYSSVRRDGSYYDPETDRQAGHAERFAARKFGAPYNDAITDGGDGGYDFELTLKSGRVIKVDAVHLGMFLPKYPRLTGHLIRNDSRELYADAYVVVRGYHEKGFQLVGWLPHKELVSQPKKDFGYGPKHACHIDDLWPIERLKEMVHE